MGLHRFVTSETEPSILLGQTVIPAKLPEGLCDSHACPGPQEMGTWTVMSTHLSQTESRCWPQVPALQSVAQCPGQTAGALYKDVSWPKKKLGLAVTQVDLKQTNRNQERPAGKGDQLAPQFQMSGEQMNETKM